MVGGINFFLPRRTRRARRKKYFMPAQPGKTSCSSCTSAQRVVEKKDKCTEGMYRWASARNQLGGCIKIYFYHEGHEGHEEKQFCSGAAGETSCSSCTSAQRVVEKKTSVLNECIDGPRLGTDWEAVLKFIFTTKDTKVTKKKQQQFHTSAAGKTSWSSCTSAQRVVEEKDNRVTG